MPIFQAVIHPSAPFSDDTFLQGILAWATDPSEVADLPMVRATLETCRRRHASAHVHIWGEQVLEDIAAASALLSDMSMQRIREMFCNRRWSPDVPTEAGLYRVAVFPDTDLDVEGLEAMVLLVYAVDGNVENVPLVDQGIERLRKRYNRLVVGTRQVPLEGALSRNHTEFVHVNQDRARTDILTAATA